MYIAEDCKYIPYGSNTKLDKLVNSKNLSDRLTAVEQNYGLDKLVYDNSWEVRYEIAKLGFGLDILIDDIIEDVRAEVAKHNYKLDILVNDEDPYVRQIVAEQGFGLDILTKDSVWFVRDEVARQGYNLDILINDEEFVVRNVVHDYLKEHNLTIEEWCIQNKKGYLSLYSYLKDFICKINDSSIIKIKTTANSIDEFFNDITSEDRIILLSRDTNISLITLEKIYNSNNIKFIVDITIDEDNYTINSIFDNKDKFIQLLSYTINILHMNSLYFKYAAELKCYS